MAAAFSRADSAAFGLMSTATTLAAPARAADSAMMPVPVPTSSTLRSRRFELRDEAREILAGDEIARMKDGRPHGEAKAVGAHGAGACGG